MAPTRPRSRCPKMFPRRPHKATITTNIIDFPSVSGGARTPYLRRQFRQGSQGGSARGGEGPPKRPKQKKKQTPRHSNFQRGGDDDDDEDEDEDDDGDGDDDDDEDDDDENQLTKTISEASREPPEAAGRPPPEVSQRPSETPETEKEPNTPASKVPLMAPRGTIDGPDRPARESESELREGGSG